MIIKTVVLLLSNQRYCGIDHECRKKNPFYSNLLCNTLEYQNHLVVLKRSEKKKTSEKWAKTTKNPENGGQNGHLDNKRSSGGGSGPGSRAANRAAGRMSEGSRPVRLGGRSVP